MEPGKLIEIGDFSKVRARGRPQRTPADERFLSKKDIAAHLGVSTTTVDTWCREKGMPYVTLHGTRRRFKVSEVERWLAG